MALGASRGDVRWMVVWQGLGLVAAGLGCGMTAAFFSSRLIATMLYGVPATAPPTVLAVALVLLGVAAVACLLPARRAIAISPIVALRAN